MKCSRIGVHKTVIDDNRNRQHANINVFHSDTLKLHLGSGARKLRGFVSIDINPEAMPDYIRDISNLHDIDSGSVQEIYSSHAIEYFDSLEVEMILREWRRILSPEGKLFIAVPDFDSLIQIYNQTKSLSTIIGPLFGRWQVKDYFIYHKSVWTIESLTKVLLNSGFTSVEKYSPVDYLVEIDPNYDDYSLAFYPHMNRSGIQVSLCLTATSNESH